MSNNDSDHYLFLYYNKIYKLLEKFKDDVDKLETTFDKDKLLHEQELEGMLPEEDLNKLQKILQHIVTKSSSSFNFYLTVQQGFYTAVDGLIFYYDIKRNLVKDLIIIRRPDGKLAPIGGFTKYGETVEESIMRECFEEVGINIHKNTIHLLGVFSGPDRDPRDLHVTALAYTGMTIDWPEVTLEAKDVYLFDKEKIYSTSENDWFAKDHKLMAIEAFEKFEKDQDHYIDELMKCLARE